MQPFIDVIKKAGDVISWIGPLLGVYPRWAQGLFVATGVLLVASMLVFGANLPRAMRLLDPSRRPVLAASPYSGFASTFREVMAPHRIPASGSLLHVVWGDLSEIREMAVVLPINQAFDFDQRGPRSALAAFESHTVGGVRFYDRLTSQWPKANRPSSAGIGTTHFLRLSGESHGLAGVMFVVTTRDRSLDPSDYGVYKNTPIENIDVILDKAVEGLRAESIGSVALPLLGAGYANIQRTHGDSLLKALLEQAVVLLSVHKLLPVLADASSPLRRAVLVIYSSDPQRKDEDALWVLLPRFVTSDAAAREGRIQQILREFSERERKQPAG